MLIITLINLYELTWKDVQAKCYIGKRTTWLKIATKV